MNLRTINEILPKTRVILRMDLDVPMENGQITDRSRLEKSIPTIKGLLAKECKIAIIGHRGRPNYGETTTDKPEGYDEDLSLRPVYLELMTMLEPNGEGMIESVFIENVEDSEKIDLGLAKNQIVFLENLRFWKGEEENNPQFLKGIVEICQAYVNDAFAVAHRRHRSIMLYKELPGFYGLSFKEEAEKIFRIINNPEKPLTIVLGGAKEDKLKYMEELTKIADHILIGGKLPRLYKESEATIFNKEKIVLAELREDGLDLSESDMKKFIEVINTSKTIVWAGAMGLFENNNCRAGTENIARAIAETNAYKVIAGGDTGASIINLGLRDKIDFICSGGGVMLDFLAKGTLPAWEN